MSRRYKSHEIAPGKTGNMTPLIDVVMQLILFLMLASAAVRPNQIQLDLPESSSSVKSPEKDMLTVTYAVHEGKADITLDEQPVATLDALGPALKASGNGKDKPIVNVRIEKSVPYQDVIRVMDVVRDAGFPKFSLLTLQSTKTGK